MHIVNIHLEVRGNDHIVLEKAEGRAVVNKITQEGHVVNMATSPPWHDISSIEARRWATIVLHQLGVQIDSQHNRVTTLVRLISMMMRGL